MTEGTGSVGAGDVGVLPDWSPTRRWACRWVKFVNRKSKPFFSSDFRRRISKKYIKSQKPDKIVENQIEQTAGVTKDRQTENRQTDETDGLVDDNNKENRIQVADASRCKQGWQSSIYLSAVCLVVPPCRHRPPRAGRRDGHFISALSCLE